MGSETLDLLIHTRKRYRICPRRCSLSMKWETAFSTENYKQKMTCLDGGHQASDGRSLASFFLSRQVMRSIVWLELMRITICTSATRVCNETVMRLAYRISSRWNGFWKGELTTTKTLQRRFRSMVHSKVHPYCWAVISDAPSCCRLLVCWWGIKLRDANATNLLVWLSNRHWNNLQHLLFDVEMTVGTMLNWRSFGISNTTSAWGSRWTTAVKLVYAIGQTKNPIWRAHKIGALATIARW